MEGSEYYYITYKNTKVDYNNLQNKVICNHPIDWMVKNKIYLVEFWAEITKEQYDKYGKFDET